MLGVVLFILKGAYTILCLLLFSTVKDTFPILFNLKLCAYFSTNSMYLCCLCHIIYIYVCVCVCVCVCVYIYNKYYIHMCNICIYSI